MKELQRLRDAGLIVYETPDNPWILRGDFAFQYAIAKPAQTPNARTYDFNHVLAEDVRVNLEFPLRPHQWFPETPGHTQRWNFWVWGCRPGPGSTDFLATYAELDSAVTAILDFYFGAPTLLDTWVVPLYRHPDLDRAAVQAALARAVPIAAVDFQALVRQRRDRLPMAAWRARPWELSAQIVFVPIPHRSDPTHTLQLRRDLQEAYLLTDVVAP